MMEPKVIIGIIIVVAIVTAIVVMQIKKIKSETNGAIVKGCPLFISTRRNNL